MPHIRYLAGRCWDYRDHHLPLSHLSLSEALNMSRFAVDEVVPRFLPYTVKDRRIPHSTRLRAHVPHAAARLAAAGAPDAGSSHTARPTERARARSALHCLRPRSGGRWRALPAARAGTSGETPTREAS